MSPRPAAALSGELSAPRVCDEADRVVAERLGTIDWDFKVRVVRHEVEGVHPYPAKFIADLPGAFLDALRLPPDSIVLDPFCGSGTTLAEAQRRGLRSVGIDLNPIACLIARVKTRPHPNKISGSVGSIAKQMRSRTHLESPAIPNVDHWFQPQVKAALTRLIFAIRSCPEEHHEFLQVAASSIIVRVSNQESDTRYAAVHKTVSESDVAEAFERACEKLSDALRAREEVTSTCNVIEGNLMLQDLSHLQGQISAIITSPPYPNAYEYWLYHKYRMWWLNRDPLYVKIHEIGARAHFFGGRGDTSSTFGEQMTVCLSSLKRTLVPGGWACFIVGRSIIHGELIDNAATIEKIGQRLGLRTVFKGTRSLLSTRKSFNLSHANIKRETVLAMRNPGQ